MTYFGNIKIINKAGWAKKIEIEKALLQIGSQASNDIVLPEEYGAGIFPLHIQMICPKSPGNAYRLINLSGNEVQIFDHKMVSKGPIPPQSSKEITTGDTVLLGEYQLHFDLLMQKRIVIEKRTEHLGVKLEMPDHPLKPEKKLSGILRLTNYGDSRRCQFDIDLEGLPVDCYKISPAPMLYPGASEELQIVFLHQKVKPQAGLQTVKITASAPGSYASEMVEIELHLQVEAVNQFSMQIVDHQPFHAKNAFAEPAFEPVDPYMQPEEIPVPSLQSTSEPYMSEPPEKLENAFIVEVPPVVQPKSQPSTPPELTNNERISIIHQPPAPVMENEPTQTLQPESVNPETGNMEEQIVENHAEEEWWSSSTVAATPPPITNTIKRDIKSRLASKDIQVIKAGEEIEEDESVVDVKGGE